MADRLPKPKLTVATNTLRPLVIELVGRSFKLYAFNHKGMTSELFNLEWKRFKKELEKIL